MRIKIRESQKTMETNTSTVNNLEIWRFGNLEIVPGYQVVGLTTGHNSSGLDL
jgi:hypothetical protein